MGATQAEGSLRDMQVSPEPLPRHAAWPYLGGGSTHHEDWMRLPGQQTPE
jgi:hypothetical protein